ncbi:hypothetical protein D3C71_1771310 [compost metagenome]
MFTCFISPGELYKKALFVGSWFGGIRDFINAVLLQNGKVAGGHKVFTGFRKLSRIFREIIACFDDIILLHEFQLLAFAQFKLPVLKHSLRIIGDALVTIIVVSVEENGGRRVYVNKIRSSIDLFLADHMVNINHLIIGNAYNSALILCKCRHYSKY